MTPITTSTILSSHLPLLFSPIPVPLIKHRNPLVPSKASRGLLTTRVTMSAVRPSPLPLSGFPHILRLISEYADRRTAVTLLRTSYQLFEIAGPVIYREVYLYHKTIGGVFLGAYKNPPSGEPEPVPEKKRGDSTDTNKKVDTGSRSAPPGLQVGKADLLKHIKIIHVTAHGRADCQPLVPIVSTLLSPDLVRIVCPRTRDRSYDSNLCGTNPCPLLHCINTRKIVFRNIDFWYWPDPELGGGYWPDIDVENGFFGPWRGHRQKEIVYFLPVEGWYNSPINQAPERIKLVIGEDIEPSPWYELGDARWRCEYIGSCTIDQLVTDFRRSKSQCRLLEIVVLETILLRDTTLPSRGEIITEEQLLIVKNRLEEGLRKTAFGRHSARQQYHREGNYDQLRWEEKQRLLEEDKLGEESLDDTASSPHTGLDP